MLGCKNSTGITLLYVLELILQAAGFKTLDCLCNNSNYVAQANAENTSTLEVG